MLVLEKFPFHLLLTNKQIPELERMIKNEEYQFQVKRLGVYQLSPTKTREFSTGTYIDKNGRIWYIERIV